MLQNIADGFTTAAVLAGLWAAFQWWKSGRVDVDPKWKDKPRKQPPDRGIEEILRDLKEMNRPERIKAFADAVVLSDRLNAHAALWTAASVALQAVATVLGRLAMP